MEDYGANSEERIKSTKEVGAYDKPWRAAMARGPRSIDPGYNDLDRLPPHHQASHSGGVLLSPKPNTDVKYNSKMGGQSSQTSSRYKKNQGSKISPHYDPNIVHARSSLHTIGDQYSGLDGYDSVGGGLKKASPEQTTKKFDYLSELRQKR